MQLINEDCLKVFEKEEFKQFVQNHKCVIVTDPPFNIGYHYKTYKDNLKEEDYLNFLANVFQKYDMPFVVIHYAEDLFNISNKLNEVPTKVVSWVYNSNTSKQHREIAFFKIKPNFNQVKQPYKNPNDKRIKERIKKGCRGGETIWLVEH